MEGISQSIFDTPRLPLPDSKGQVRRTPLLLATDQATATALRCRSEHFFFEMSEDGQQLNPSQISPHFHPVNTKSIIPLVAAL